MTGSDQLVRQISAALAHIDKHGTLQGFAGVEDESRSLIDAASAQHLIEWNDETQRYRLSPAARKWLTAYYRGSGRRELTPAMRQKR